MTSAGLAEMLPPRPYQIEAIKAVEAAHARGVKRPAVELPTGSGKTVVFSRLIKRRHERPWGDGGGRTLVLAHRSELIDQAVSKLNDVAPGLNVGVVQAERNETRADVVVASVQTLRNEMRRRMIADVGLIVVDEAHHAPADSYLRVLAHYGAWGDGGPVGQDICAVAVGFTATMLRGDGKALGDVWQEVVYSRSIGEMVAAGYLVRPRGIRVYVEDLDLRGVKRSRGDYAAGDLGRAIEESQAPEAVVKAIAEHCPQDPGIIFTPTVETARTMTTVMNDAGASVRMVWGEMAADARKRALDEYRAGDVDWLVNPQLLTEGTDLPRAKVAVIARPTRSAGLFIQMAGRVLRPYRDPHTGQPKTEALLLDLVGATAEHSLQSKMSLFGEEAAALAREQDEIERDDEQIAAGALDMPAEDIWRDSSGPVGALVSEEVDLFHSSASAWLRTYGGIWFLPAGERIIALIPGVEMGTWDVTAMHATIRGTGRWIALGVRELSYAMAWAESEVTPAERMAVAREQSWRDHRPAPAQRSVAESLGIKIGRGMTKGELAGLINIAGASWRIDPHVPQYAKGR